jgi:hypothetical protein
MHRTHHQHHSAAAQRKGAWMEALEHRAHQSFTLITDDYISEITGYSLFAEACYGDNGDPWGQEETGMGGSAGSYSFSDVEWDSDFSDGFDSGHRQVYFRADAGDNFGVWWVDGGEMLTGGFDLDSIGGVMIRVAVLQPQMSMSWESGSIGFFNNGRLVRSEGLPDMIASTLDDGWEEQTTLHVDMPTVEFDEVRIGGLIRLQAGEGVYPSANDMYAQVFIFEGQQS